MRYELAVVVYQDLKQDGRHGYEFKSYSGDEPAYILKNNIIPGLYGFPDMYIRTIPLKDFTIISQTDYELTPHKITEIISGANECFQQHKTSN